MRLLLLNQFFHPDLAATAQLATDLAEDLVVAGHEVTVVATRGAYLGGGRLPARETWRGVRIERVWSTSLGKGSVLRRLADYGTFYASAAWRLLTGPRPDLVVAMSTPPLVAALGAAARAWRGVPFVYWLQDVYPELAVELGVMRRGGLAHRCFEALARWTLRRTDGVVVLGEAMGERIAAKSYERSRIHVVPNWADGAAVTSLGHGGNAFRADHGLGDRRVVLYSGNMGRAHDLQTVLQVARSMREAPEVVFVFIGDGHLRGEVEAAARELPNVRLLPYQPRERLTESLSAGDVHVVTQRDEVLGLVEPSKLYGALAVGRPVLYVGPAGSEAARTIQVEGLGEVVAVGDAVGARAALERLLARPAGDAARIRAVFEARYDRRHRTAALEQVLSAVAAGRPAPRKG